MLKQLTKNIYYSFPVQLFILHFRKYQILLLFWFLLTSTINSGFMKTFGADALFFSPEYLGNVNFLGSFITGAALGFFLMSWNITTFILHSKRFKFLATTAKPFFKYCINNAVLPLLFLLFYFIRLYQFDADRELMNTASIRSDRRHCFRINHHFVYILYLFFRRRKNDHQNHCTDCWEPSTV